MTSKLSLFVFGDKPQSTLPARIEAAVRDHQDASERIIGCVQLAVVVMFGLLYAVSPNPVPHTILAMPHVEPVPWVLAAYFAFTLTRLWLSFVRRLPGWLVALSVVIDMALLLGTIWTFHLKYDQPPSFYLKAPTMLYIFIFISLRALRFDPRFVVAAGATAAAGWLVLLAYALLESGGEAITRDYVRYMTSNRVLIGGEVDRIISILMVTLILAVVLVRARRLLDLATSESTAARELSRFVSPEVASHIASAEREMQPGDGEVKHASVLFTDIEGFSTTAQRLKPAELFGTLNDYFQAISDVIDRHGGVITQFAGDAILVSYNTIKADPDHAANAVRTAIDIQELVNGRRFGAGAVMKTRCGINTGELMAGAVGSKDRLLYTVHGDEVNIASRLDDLNKELGTYVLATARTVAETGGEFAFERVGEVTVRGRATPTNVFALRV